MARLNAFQMSEKAKLVVCPNAPMVMNGGGGGNPDFEVVRQPLSDWMEGSELISRGLH
jgi:hypothetical protein